MCADKPGAGAESVVQNPFRPNVRLVHGRGGQFLHHELRPANARVLQSLDLDRVLTHHDHLRSSVPGEWLSLIWCILQIERRRGMVYSWIL